MCDSASYGYDCPATLEDFLLDCWMNHCHDGAFGNTDEIGWHVVFVGDDEIGYYSMTTTHTGNVSIGVYKDREEFQSDWEQVEKEEAEFYASDEEAFPDIA